MITTNNFIAIAVFVTLPAISILNVHARSLWVLALALFSSDNNRASWRRKEEENDEEVDCAICLRSVREGESYQSLRRCGHGFHADCIGKWLKAQATCPLCRAPVLNYWICNKRDSGSSTDDQEPPYYHDGSAPTSMISAGHFLSNLGRWFLNPLESELMLALTQDSSFML